MSCHHTEIHNGDTQGASDHWGNHGHSTDMTRRKPPWALIFEHDGRKAKRRPRVKGGSQGVKTMLAKEYLGKIA